MDISIFSEEMQDRLLMLARYTPSMEIALEYYKDHKITDTSFHRVIRRVRETYFLQHQPIKWHFFWEFFKPNKIYTGDEIVQQVEKHCIDEFPLLREWNELVEKKSSEYLSGEAYLEDKRVIMFEVIGFLSPYWEITACGEDEEDIFFLRKIKVSVKKTPPEELAKEYALLLEEQKIMQKEWSRG